MKQKKMKPLHPGDVLLDEFLKPMGLSRYFKVSPQFWLGLQTDYDLDVEEDKIADRLEREVRVMAGTR